MHLRHQKEATRAELSAISPSVWGVRGKDIESSRARVIEPRNEGGDNQGSGVRRANLLHRILSSSRIFNLSTSHFSPLSPQLPLSIVEISILQLRLGSKYSRFPQLTSSTDLPPVDCLLRLVASSALGCGCIALPYFTVSLVFQIKTSPHNINQFCT